MSKYEVRESTTFPGVWSVLCGTVCLASCSSKGMADKFAKFLEVTGKGALECGIA